MNEKYNAEAVAQALKDATSKIEEVCTNFNNERQNVSEKLGASGSAVGGTLGQVANAAFEAENVDAFENLKKNMNSFMNRTEQIAKNTASAEDSTTSLYSQRV